MLFCLERLPLFYFHLYIKIIVFWNLAKLCISSCFIANLILFKISSYMLNWISSKITLKIIEQNVYHKLYLAFLSPLEACLCYHTGSLVWMLQPKTTDTSLRTYAESQNCWKALLSVPSNPLLSRDTSNRLPRTTLTQDSNDF